MIVSIFELNYQKLHEKKITSKKCQLIILRKKINKIKIKNKYFMKKKEFTVRNLNMYNCKNMIKDN